MQLDRRLPYLWRILTCSMAVLSLGAVAPRLCMAQRAEVVRLGTSRNALLGDGTRTDCFFIGVVRQLGTRCSGKWGEHAMKGQDRPSFQDKHSPARASHRRAWILTGTVIVATVAVVIATRGKSESGGDWGGPTQSVIPLLSDQSVTPARLLEGRGSIGWRTSKHP